MKQGVPDLEEIRAGGKRALARALSMIETQAGTQALAHLLDAAFCDPRGRVIGLTGPPGVGKSTLTRALLGEWRARGETVGVLAVDPSSRVSGGALLGDRVRIAGAAADDGLFIRSMAARDRLGGLSAESFGAIALMRAVFDRVLVESVGVGQSEDEVAIVADALILCVQPQSGDSLQFMKAGLLERPDLVVVTKSDLGAMARRAAAEAQGALRLGAIAERPAPPVLLASAATGAGLAEVITQAEAAAGSARAQARRAGQARAFFEHSLRARFGIEGLSALAGASPGAELDHAPFAQELRVAAILRARLRADRPIMGRSGDSAK